MNMALVLLAGFGLGVAVYSALETEPEEIGRRAFYGLLGLLIFIAAIMFI